MKNVVILRPSLLLSERVEKQSGERWGQVLMKATNFLFAGWLKKYRAIAASTVAQAMMQAAFILPEGKHIMTNERSFELSENYGLQRTLK